MMNKSRFIKKISVLLLTTIMTVAMFMVAAFAADEVDEDVKDARNGVLQLQLVYEDKDGNSTMVGGGTAFLINEDTVLTCYHVVHLEESEENYQYAKDLYGNDFDLKNVVIKIVVTKDVTYTAKILKDSEQMDFAICQLEQPIYGTTPLKLNDDKNLSETQQIYALGFPDAVSYFQTQNTFTASDVTISDGRVTKTNQSDGVNYVQHSASLSSGSSGGPLVSQDGSVVAINRGSVNQYYYSVAISQIREVLDKLGVEYTDAAQGTAKPEETETVQEQETEKQSVTQAESATERQVPTIANDKKDNDNGKIMIGNLPLAAFIAIIAGVLAIIVVVIVVILVITKKKKADKPSQNTAPYMATPSPASSAPQRPISPSSSYTRPSEGAGETTVLNEGAGETTVLGSSAPVIKRSKTGEQIKITRPEFVIGKERNRVDYCISANNSVSRTHAKIVNRGGQLYIMDMNATNGTFVNGSRISPNQEIRLSSGDRIKLADEEFIVQ